MDVNFYIEKLNSLELEILNNYLINLRFGNTINEDELQYLLITIDKNKNIRFQAYLCIVKTLFDIYINKYLDNNTKQYFIEHSEIYINYTNTYNFNVNDIIENLVQDLKRNEFAIILENLHTNFLNTEIVIKNGLFRFENSKLNSKNTGSIYTKSSIAREICQNTIKNNNVSINNINNIRILDFASGTGRFYIEMLDILVNSFKISEKQLILKNLYAIDIDEIATNILRLKVCNYFDNLQVNDLEILFKNIICKNILINQTLSLFQTNNELFNPLSDFKDILQNGGFDIVVSNPPYAILKVNKKNVIQKAYQNYYQELTAKINNEINYFNNSGCYQYAIEGMLNYYKLSIEKILTLCNKNANIGIICPATLFTDCSSKKIRKYLLLYNEISEINYFQEKANLFDNVSQATVIFYLTRNKTTNDIKIISGQDSFNININDIKKSFSNLEIPYINKIGWTILHKLTKFKKLKENTNIRNKRGELDLTLYKDFITNSPTKFRLVRGNMISEENGIINKNNEYVLENFIDKKSEDYLNNDFNQARLICQQISNIDSKKRLNFTVSESHDIIANSCNYLTIKNKHSLTTLLAIMNSYLLNWRFKISSGNNHINNYELDELPIIDYDQNFKSNNKLDLNIEICKKYNLSNEETEYILKDFYSKETLNTKLGEVINV